MGYSVTPRYPEPPYGLPQDQQKPTPTLTYSVSNTLRVRVRDLTKIGTVIDAAMAAGANNVQDVTFDLTNPGSVRQQSLVQALKNAESKARLVASTLHAKLGKVISVTANEASAPMPEYSTMATMRAEAAPTPIVPGEVPVATSVTVVYSIL